MTYPQYKNKHLEEALFHPQDFLKYKKVDLEGLPSNYVITYQEYALKYLKKTFGGKYRLFNLNPNCQIYILKNKDIGFTRMGGIGSPHAVTVFEELIGLGGKKFINIGTAGGLQHEGAFLCDRAIRDEGTSHHYYPHGKYSYPDKNLTERLARAIEKQNLEYEKATTWTIDAPYRETKAEIARYKKEGVATVEMEASALFAVAKYRNVKIASAFVASDILGEKWIPQFHHLNVRKTQNKLLDAAINCLKGEK